MSVALEPLRIARTITTRFGALGGVLPDERTLAAELRKLTLRELAEIKSGLDGNGGGAVSVNGLAEGVLRLESDGSKLSLIERAVILQAIAAAGGNMSAAARLVGMDRKAFVRRAARARRRH